MALVATVFILDSWGDSQFGAPYDHLGKIAIWLFQAPILGRGVARSRLGAEVPKLHQNVGTCISKLKFPKKFDGDKVITLR